MKIKVVLLSDSMWCLFACFEFRVFSVSHFVAICLVHGLYLMFCFAILFLCENQGRHLRGAGGGDRRPPPPKEKEKKKKKERKKEKRGKKRKKEKKKERRKL